MARNGTCFNTPPKLSPGHRSECQPPPSLTAVALSHKNPKVKLETLKWLEAVVPKEKRNELGATAATIVPACVKCAKEADLAVRECANDVLAEYIKAVSGGAGL